MKFVLCFVAGFCVCAGSAGASVLPIYVSNPDGSTVAPTVGATDDVNALVTSFIFGEVSVDPGYAGQPIYAMGVNFTAPVSIQVGILEGLWADDGPDGGPGTLLDWGLTTTLAITPGNWSFSLYTGYPVPAGDFWVGYAFETYDTPSTTAAQLNTLTFELGSTPILGTTSTDALLGSQAGVIGNDPAISGSAGGYLSQGISLYTPDVPETSTWTLGMGGAVLLGGFRFLRRRNLI